MNASPYQTLLNQGGKFAVIFDDEDVHPLSLPFAPARGKLRVTGKVKGA